MRFVLRRPLPLACTVGAIQIGLVLLNAALSFLHLRIISIVVAYLLAIAAAGLTLVIGMDVRHSPGLIRLASIAGLLWLGIMFTLALADYATR